MTETKECECCHKLFPRADLNTRGQYRVCDDCYYAEYQDNPPLVNPQQHDGH